MSRFLWEPGRIPYFPDKMAERLSIRNCAGAHFFTATIASLFRALGNCWIAGFAGYYFVIRVFSFAEIHIRKKIGRFDKFAGKRKMPILPLDSRGKEEKRRREKKESPTTTIDHYLNQVKFPIDDERSLNFPSPFNLYRRCVPRICE